MNNEFEGKGFVVTGAGSGMGRAEAISLAGKAAKVWVTDINSQAGAAVVDVITAAGGSAEFFELNVADANRWNELAAVINTQDGKLDGLVNNAGVNYRFGILDTSVEEWHRVMDINLSSIFYGMKAMAPLIAEATGGSIVNVSSVAGMIGYFGAAYGTSKWGVRGLSKVGALEFASQNIRVNSIHPGLIDTPLLRSGSTEYIDVSIKSIPLGRVARSAEVANAVEFLLSDKSQYITGAEIVIDGGLTSGGLYHGIMNGVAATA